MADIDRIDLELIGGEAGFEKRQGHRIGLFACGAGRGEDAERSLTRAGGEGGGTLPERIEDLRVSEKPALRYDHLVDEPISLCVIAGEVGQEDRFVGFAAGTHPHPHGAGDGGAAHGVHIEPDPTLQQGLGRAARRCGVGGDGMSDVGMHGEAG